MTRHLARFAAAALILNGLAQPMLAASPFPEPPREAHKFLPPGTINQFNPQPEPPRIRSLGVVSRGGMVTLNPQPEVPSVPVDPSQPAFNMR